MEVLSSELSGVLSSGLGSSAAVAKDEQPDSLPTSERGELQRLAGWHLRAAELYLGGCSQDEIARALGKHNNTVHFLVKSPLFQDLLARRRQEQTRQIDAALVKQTVDASTIIHKASTGAARKLVELLDTGDHKIQLLASKDILDRAGFVPKQAGQQNLVVCNINVDMAQNLMIALRESQALRAVAVQRTLVEQAESKGEAVLPVAANG